MVKNLFLLNLIILSLTVNSQNQNSKNTSYFDKNGNLAYVESAHYYRQNTDTLNYYRSFYIGNNVKYFEGSIIAANDTIDSGNKYNGLCIWYYLNGNIRMMCEFNNSGILNGIKKEFTNNGKLIKNSIYENGKVKDKKYTEFDEDGTQINVFEEDFLDNSLNWPLENNENRSSKIKIGGLILVNKLKDSFATSIKCEIDSANYSIETTINSRYLTPECKSGIVFGFKDWDNYNYFYVSKFRFHVGFIENGVTTKTIENYFCDDLKGTDLNKLKILCLNDSLYFYINNELQNYCFNIGFKGNKFGFYVSNGSSFFDNLVIKQYRENKYYQEPKKKTFLNVGEQMVPITQVFSGLLLGENGYILTSLKKMDQINGIFVELNVNDTIKSYQVDFFSNSNFFNFSILKIRDTIKRNSFKPNYHYMKSLVSEKNFISYNFEIDSITNSYKLNKLTGDLKSICSHKHSFDGIKNNHCCEGSPIFNSEGYILGVITVSEKNKIQTISIQQILSGLFSYPQTNEIKPKSDVNFIEFEKEIYKNIVIIKTF